MNSVIKQHIRWRGLDLVINDRVLVPREETELLVIEGLCLGSARWVHEVGTGCGAVALAIAKERPDLIVTASDIDPHAIEVAQANAERLDIEIGFWQGPGLSRLNTGKEGADFPDLIVANLPYLSDEAMTKRPPKVAEKPRLATQGECGADGLGEIRQLISETPASIKIALEHDTHHGPAVRDMLEKSKTHNDWTGQERMTVGFAKGWSMEVIKIEVDRALAVDFVNDADPASHHRAEKQLVAEMREAVKESDRESVFEEHDWETGANYVHENGSPLWRMLRQEKGWSRDDVWEKTDGICLPPAQEIWEDHIGFPEWEELEALATLYELTPGELLDRVYEMQGRMIRKEHEEEVEKFSVSEKL
jgi:release factor glutamine methyltransferase